MTEAVAAEDVWKYYGDYPALREITLTIDPGSCVALLGRNGAGKTTLLRIIAGLSKAGRGRVSILGKDARDPETRRRVGVLGHGISVYEELSAFENLTLFGQLYGVENPAKTAADWLDRVGLSRVRDGLVREFSRGMRQRLALERAVLHRPRLVLLDEPFTGLDDRAVGVVAGRLRQLAADGAIVVMATHDLDLAEGLVSRVAVMREGRLVSDEPAAGDLRARYRALIGS